MPLRSFTPEEILITNRRRLEIPLLLLVWLGVTSASLAEGNWFYVLAGTLAVGVNLAAVIAAKELYVHRVLVNISVLCATVVLMLEVIPRPDTVVVALRHFLILIQLCKLFERKTNRDYVQMLTLSLLLMVAAAMAHQQMWFAIAMLLHMTLTAYVAMIFTLKRGLDAAAGARLAGESTSLTASQLAWDMIHRWPGGPLLRRLALVLAVMLSCGAVIFLITPRGSLAWDRPEDLGSAGASVGFGGKVTLGQKKRLYESDRVVMRVAIGVPEGSTARPPFPLYLRGVSYDQYGGGRNSSWSQGQNWSTRLPPEPMNVANETDDDDSPTDIPGGPNQPAAGQDSGRHDFAVDVSMSPTFLPAVFGSGMALSAQPGGWPFQLKSNGDIELLPGSFWEAGPVRYQIRCLDPAAPAPVRQAYERLLPARPVMERSPDRWRLPRIFRHRDGEGPESVVFVAPPVASLAQEWCADLLQKRSAADASGQEMQDEINLAIARRLADRLKDEYPYSLDFTDADPSRDGVEDFLFHLKRGHCEYFASAHVVMCRSLGVTARLVTGFLVDAPPEADGTYLVRDRDAHAWSEVHTKSSGWVTMDATSGRMAQARPAGWWQAFIDRLNAMQFGWYENVIGYGEQQRQRLWDAAAGLVSSMGDWFAEAGQAIAASTMNLLLRGEVDLVMWIVIGLVAAAAIAAEAALVTGYLRRARHQRMVEADPVEQARRQLDFVLKLFVQMERLGLPSRTDQTLRDSAAAATAQFNLDPSALDQLVSLYYRQRWGNHPAQGAELEEARLAAQGIHERLGGRPSPV